MLGEDDILVAWNLDRLIRGVEQLVDRVGDLHKQGIQFNSLTEAIDTGTSWGRFMFLVMTIMQRWSASSPSRAHAPAWKLPVSLVAGEFAKMTGSEIGSDEKLLDRAIPPLS
jgi:hypothetical protein